MTATKIYSKVFPTYDDLPPYPLLAAKPGGASPTLAAFGTVTQLYTFAVNDICYGSTEIIHGYNEGSSLYFHVHWATNGVDIAAKGVKWEVSYTIANGAASAPFSAFADDTSVSAETSIPANTTTKSHIITSIATVVGTGLRIGAKIIWSLKRIAAVGDAPTSNPFGIAFGVHVEQDSTGSRQLYIK